MRPGDTARVGFRAGLAHDIATNLNLHSSQVTVPSVSTPASGSMAIGAQIGLSNKDMRDDIENMIICKVRQGAFPLRNARQASTDHLDAKAL